MPVTLNIIADNAVDLVDEFRKLNALTTDRPFETLDNTPTDVLIDKVRDRLRADGFKLEIIDQRDPVENQIIADAEAQMAATRKEAVDRALQGEPEPKAKTKRAKPNGGVPAEIITEPSTILDEDITLPRPKKASKASPMPLEEEALEPDPAGDRQHVLDTLAGILKDPKQKDRVLGFASGMAKQHGKDKISELPVDPFPEIRRAMEKEFPNA